MTAALEVRDLCVVFAGPPQPSPIDGSVSTFTPEASQESLQVPAGHRVGLVGVTFTVHPGDCLALLGASGAGKSSLLRTLAGLQAAGRGSIVVNGRDVRSLPPEQRGVVYLHQEPVLFPHLRVLENVMFPMTVRGTRATDAQRRAMEMLDRLRVASRMGNYPDALSGGERHRVALARALCADPAVLLLDEPLASLDPAVRREVRDALLTARAASGAAVVLVTHDVDDAMAIATQVSAIGSFADVTPPAPPADLLHSPPTLQVARLLGVFAELTGRVEHGVFHWSGGTIAAPDVESGVAVACVRAHECCVIPRPTQGERPVLEVIARRDAAHEIVLRVRHADGGEHVLRVGSATSAQVGDQVQVSLRHARIFPVR